MATPPPPPRAPYPSVRERLRDEGFWEVGRSYIADRWAGVTRRLAHRHVAPRLSEMYNLAERQTTDVRSIAAGLRGFPTERWDDLKREFAEVSSRLSARYQAALAYPTISAFSLDESWLVFALVRGLAPQLVVETGVANGHSSFVILEALHRNGAGRLLSIDVRPDVGALVPPELKDRWDLRLLSRRAPRRDLAALVQQIPSIDLFIHDSDHTYRWQMLELTLVWPRLSARGLLTSDDADWSYAFLDFSARQGRRPSFLISENKAFGLLSKAP